MRTAYYTVLVCVFCVGCTAQQSSELPTELKARSAVATTTSEPLASIGKMFRAYLRDIAETQFNVHSTITTYGTDKTPDSTARKKHKFRVEGVRLRVEDSHITGIFEKVDRGTFWLQTLPDYSSWLDALVLTRLDVNSDIAFSEPQLKAGTLTVSYRSEDNCRAFEPGKKWMQWSLTTWCGDGAVTLDATTLLPISSRFHARGLPLSDGKKHLDDYRVELEFQVVQVADGNGRRILPKKASATFVTEKGRIVVENVFLLPTGPQS